MTINIIDNMTTATHITSQAINTSITKIRHQQCGNTCMQKQDIGLPVQVFTNLAVISN